MLEGTLYYGGSTVMILSKAYFPDYGWVYEVENVEQRSLWVQESVLILTGTVMDITDENYSIKGGTEVVFNTGNSMKAYYFVSSIETVVYGGVLFTLCTVVDQDSFSIQIPISLLLPHRK